jgi:hypothetical protein
VTVDGIAVEIAGLSLASQKEIGELFGLLVLAPARFLAGVSKPWREASVAEVSEFLQVLAIEPPQPAAERLRGAARPHLRRLVRASRTPGRPSAIPVHQRVFLMQDPIKAGLAAGWKHIDASTLARDQTWRPMWSSSAAAPAAA